MRGDKLHAAALLGAGGHFVASTWRTRVHIPGFIIASYKWPSIFWLSLLGGLISYRCVITVLEPVIRTPHLQVGLSQGLEEEPFIIPTWTPKVCKTLCLLGWFRRLGAITSHTLEVAARTAKHSLNGARYCQQKFLVIGVAPLACWKA